MGGNGDSSWCRAELLDGAVQVVHHEALGAFGAGSGLARAHRCAGRNLRANQLIRD